MKKIFGLTFISLICCTLSYAQCEIKGQVYYGEPLETGVGAVIRETVSKTGVLANESGYFSYTCTSNKKISVQFSSEGMEPVEYIFDGSKYSEYRIRVTLFPKPKTFTKGKKSYISIKEKTRKPIPSIDYTPPTISVVNLDEHSKTKTYTEKFVIQGNVTDNSGIKELSINGIKTVFDKDGNFSQSVYLVLGINKIEIKATDLNNNQCGYTNIITREKELSDNGKRAALIIGNSDYKVSKLVNTLNDARDLSQKLQSYGFETVKYENLSNKETLENAIIEFCDKVKNFDLIVFYYSGHGLQVGGENYMVPTMATLNSEEVVKSYCLDINSVLNEMTGAQCKYKVVILDACRDNPFEKKWVGKSSKNYGKGLAEKSYSTNTLLIYATAPGSIASDNLSGRNGLFTQELLKNMDKDISIDQIFKLTGKSVANISGNCQVPWISSSLFEDVYLKN